MLKPRAARVPIKHQNAYFKDAGFMLMQGAWFSPPLHPGVLLLVSSFTVARSPKSV